MGTEHGNQNDFILGTELGWDAFQVVRFEAQEALHALFRYDIVLQRPTKSGEVDLAALLGTPATFAVATEERWRPVHGIITEAELLEQTHTMLLYRVLLEPHAVIMAHRTHCRTFVDKSLVHIVETALDGLLRHDSQPRHPPRKPVTDTFLAPSGAFRWALSDDARAKTPKRFVAQYNESDWDFVARLLEDEGISIFFEHGWVTGMMTMTDRPGHTPLFARDEKHALVGAAGGMHAGNKEVVLTFRPRHRLRSGKVTMRDYAWRKSLTRLEATSETNAPLGLTHYEFPARDEDEPQKPAAAPARFAAERFVVERHLSEGSSTVRTHEPGFSFELHDPLNVREDVDLLLVSVHSYGQQMFPKGTVLDFEPFGRNQQRGHDKPFFEACFEALPARLQYRPARATQRPRIHGVQSARVTAEEVAPDDSAPELNSDEMSRVRVRFPWDQRDYDGTPTSKWIRVSQYWAGPAFGAVYVPRVGHEVLIAFERGDPDRPMVVGRVYNGQNQPPYVERNTTRSTIKSDSVGEDGSSEDGFNELRFEDAKGREEVFLHAQRNLNEVVLASHSTSVGGSQSNTVGVDQSNEVGGDRTHTIHGSETCTVEGTRDHVVLGTETVTVGSHRTTTYRATETHSTTAKRTVTVGGNQLHKFCSNHDMVVTGNQHVKVCSNQQIDVTAFRGITAANETTLIKGLRTVQAGEQAAIIDGTHALYATLYTSIAPTHKFAGNVFEVQAGSATLHMSSGLIVLNNGAGTVLSLSGSTLLVAATTIVEAGSATHITVAPVQAKLGAVITIAASAVLTCSGGGNVSISSGGNVNVSGAEIKLN